MARLRLLDRVDPPDPGGFAPFSVDGHQLLQGGVPVGPSIGLRCGSAPITQADTDKVLAMLDPNNPDGYAPAGEPIFKFITICLQGTSGGATRAWTQNGTAWDPSVHGPDADANGVVIKNRAKAIIEAAEAVGVGVLLMLFYQGATGHLSNLTAYQNAAALAVEEFGSYPNVVYNIANENNTWKPSDGYPVPFGVATNVIAVADTIAATGTSQLIGAGGYGRYTDSDYEVSTTPLFTAENVHLLLFDGFQTRRSGNIFLEHMTYSSGTAPNLANPLDPTYARKPCGDVEIAGGWTRTIHATQGAYTDTAFNLYRGCINDVFTYHHRGLIFTSHHDNRWQQSKSITQTNLNNSPGAVSPPLNQRQNRYDYGNAGLASLGTVESPGIGWFPSHYLSLSP